MKRSLTLFRNVFDKKTHRKVEFKDWESFENALHSMFEKPGFKPTKADPFDPAGSPLFSPAQYRPGTTRANDNVTHWGGWMAMDIDKFDGSVDSALERFKNFTYVCYNSASSTKEKPKFRMVMPTTREVEADEIAHFWFASNKEFGELGDAQTKDLSRLYYVPAQYPGAFSFCFSNHGKEINPTEFMDRHAWVKPASTFLDALPQAYRDAILQHKKDGLKNTKFSWTGIDDCPFVWRENIAAYMAITETGWYAKMYSFMCAIARSAIKKGYPITPGEIATLCRELDNRTGQWYKGRNFEQEAERAISHMLKIV